MGPHWGWSVMSWDPLGLGSPSPQCGTPLGLEILLGLGSHEVGPTGVGVPINPTWDPIGVGVSITPSLGPQWGWGLHHPNLGPHWDWGLRHPNMGPHWGWSVMSWDPLGLEILLGLGSHEVGPIGVGVPINPTWDPIGVGVSLGSGSLASEPGVPLGPGSPLPPAPPPPPVSVCPP